MKISSKSMTKIILLLTLGFLFRCIFALLHKGFTSDMSWFAFWAHRAYKGGFSAFYSTDILTDYPPGYIYILYVIGALHSVLELDYLSPLSMFLLRLPAILCDLGTCYIIYRVAVKRFSELHSLMITAFYLFNPAVILNSSIWGQVDSIFVLMVLIMVLLLMEEKNISAYYVYAVGILLKPQTIIFTPLLLFGIYENVFAKDFSSNKFWKNLLCGLGAIAMMILVSLPFGLDKVFSQYVSTLNSYPYLSVNAYNLWGLLGKNWASQNANFLFFTYKELGTIIIVILVLFSAFVFLKRRTSADRYFLSGSFISLTMFLFGTRMHERYLYPVMLMLLMAFIMTGSKYMMYSYLILTFCHFLNVWHVLTYYTSINSQDFLKTVPALSLVMIEGAHYFYYSLYRIISGKGDVPLTLPFQNKSNG